ncbi:hypothetical protein AAE478_003246 [Parahypoxylon ruwenzoriense]
MDVFSQVSAMNYTQNISMPSQPFSGMTNNMPTQQFSETPETDSPNSYLFGSSFYEADIPEEVRPTLPEMMESATRDYQGFIRGIDDYERIMDQYLHTHDVEGGPCTDFPADPEGQRHLVKVLLEASCNCTYVYEPENGQSVKRVQDGSYTDLELELISWKLLMAVRDAQEGRCKLPRYMTCKIPKYVEYGSFNDRFNQVLRAVRCSKDVVASLFKDALFIHRLAWQPEAELKTKARNRTLNEDRDLQNSIGIRATIRDGIKKDQNGNLVDANGQFYGSARKRSAALEADISRVKKRPRNAIRKRFADQVRMGDSQEHDDITTEDTTNEDGNTGYHRHIEPLLSSESHSYHTSSGVKRSCGRPQLGGEDSGVSAPRGSAALSSVVQPHQLRYTEQTSFNLSTAHSSVQFRSSQAANDPPAHCAPNQTLPPIISYSHYLHQTLQQPSQIGNGSPTQRGLHQTSPRMEDGPEPHRKTYAVRLNTHETARR